jgi:hypothetical protein
MSLGRSLLLCRYARRAKNSGFIQQETVFWRRNLWEQIGSRISDRCKFAADFHLWVGASAAHQFTASMRLSLSSDSTAIPAARPIATWQRSIRCWRIGKKLVPASK